MLGFFVVDIAFDEFQLHLPWDGVETRKIDSVRTRNDIFVIKSGVIQC